MRARDHRLGRVKQAIEASPVRRAVLREAYEFFTMFGTVGLHIWGWPKKLVLPPYEFQAKRLLARLDNIRGRIDQNDPNWSQVQAEAIVRFRQTG